MYANIIAAESTDMQRIIFLHYFLEYQQSRKQKTL